MFVFSVIGKIFGHPVASRLRQNGVSRKKAGPPHNVNRVAQLVHGVAEIDEGFIGVFETNEATTGIFDLKCGIDR